MKANKPKVKEMTQREMRRLISERMKVLEKSGRIQALGNFNKAVAAKGDYTAGMFKNQ